MKSIKQQYIDLTEGRMSQNNFMRSMRRSLPQYITNVSSFKDTVKILKNKGIISEMRYTPDTEGMLDTIAQDAGSYESAVVDLEDYGVDTRTAEMIASKFHKELDENYTDLDDSSDFEDAVEMSLEDLGLNPMQIKAATDYLQNNVNALQGMFAMGDKTSEAAKYIASKVKGKMNEDDNSIKVNQPDYKGTIKKVDGGYELYDANGNIEDKEAGPFGTISSLMLYYDISKDQLHEAKEVGVGYYNQDGKELYAPFNEIDHLNGQEVFTGIGIEHECFPEKSYAEIEKIVIKNLKKNQFYYTDYKLSGVAGAEPKIEGGVKPEDRQMKPIKDGNVTDKAMGMKPVKGFEKAKASSNKAKKETVKGEKVDIMSLVAQTVRGLVKMDPTGEKGKKIAMKEIRINLAPGEKPNAAVERAEKLILGNNKFKAVLDIIKLQNSKNNAILSLPDGETLSNDLINVLKLQFNVVEEQYDDEDRLPSFTYVLTPKPTRTASTPGEAVAKALTKEDIEAMVREVMDETFDGRDNLMDPIAAGEYSNN